jgi:hypothetical protein
LALLEASSTGHAVSGRVLPSADPAKPVAAPRLILRALAMLAELADPCWSSSALPRAPVRRARGAVGGRA